MLVLEEQSLERWKLSGRIIRESSEDSESRNEKSLISLNTACTLEVDSRCLESYQKVKETASEVLSRSGGVARFSIAAFASNNRGGQSSPRSGRLTRREAPEPLIAGSNAATASR
jgi:hypothetical protein